MKLHTSKRWYLNLMYYRLLKFYRFFTNNCFAKKDHKFLFILSPPFCGSTLLTEILSTSNNVSCNNNIGLKEGQHLPGVHNLLFTEDRWDPNKKIDWNRIKNLWNKYWDLSKSVLLEKSPPNICRAKDIDKFFSNSKYICLVRNPYAQIQSNIRRYNTDVKIAAEKYINYLKFQKDNIETLENTLVVSYEELADNPLKTKDKICEFLPVLEDININLKFTAHNIRKKKKMGITNLNKESISTLSKEQIENINMILNKEQDLLKYFNYSIL